MSGRSARRSILAAGWEFQEHEAEAKTWYPSIGAPTTVHSDLEKLGIIPDYTKDLNEKAVQWVGETAWVYRTTVRLDHQTPLAELVFEGLDTFSTVKVDGRVVLETDNMFLKHRVPLVDIVNLKTAESITLEIIFHSAFQRGRELVEEHRQEHSFLVRQTDVGRLPVRKAQYHWGWDWGPIIMTCGPWQPIFLEQYEMRIEDVWVEYEISQDLNSCTGTIFIEVTGLDVSGAKVELAWDNADNDGVAARSDHKWTEVKEQQEKSDGRKVSKVPLALSGSQLKLWYPRGYGPQSRYGLAVRIRDGDANLDVTQKEIGFRRVELIQEPDAKGKSFYFRINNIDIFAGGSCWIPPHNLLPAFTGPEYERWMNDVADGNQIMVRIWGGGVYADDKLVEACDAKGILIWQDFMFACGNYPAYTSFLESVKTEARQQVRRLRTHPSMVIWAGNNEDYEVQQRYGLQYDFEDKDHESWLKSDFPARYIYEALLPDVLKEEDPTAVYHPSSPWGDGKHTTDPTVGDTHQWNIWHGAMRKYQDADQLGSRFISEFGMEAYPHLQTIEKMITSTNQRRPGSMPMEFHNKAIEHSRRMISYVAENFQVNYELSAFTHLTQIVQADCMRSAYKSWRRDWGRRGDRGCGGVLVWQLNDCWPTMSWAVIDYYGLRKPGYWAIKRALRPLDVCVKRRLRDWTQTTDWVDERSQLKTGQVDYTEFAKDIFFDVWIASSRSGAARVTLTTRFISIATGHDLVEPIRLPITAIENGTTPVWTDKAAPSAGEQDPRKAFDMGKYDPYVISVSLFEDGVLVAEDDDWPQPIKYLEMSPALQWSKPGDADADPSWFACVIATDKPVKGIVFQEREDWIFNTNGFDLMPGSRHLLKIKHRDDRADWKASLRDLRFTYIGASGPLEVPDWLLQ